MAIACISAFPAMINPGMISCDLALDSVLARIGVAGPVDRFNLEQYRKVGPVESRLLRSPGLLEKYDAILYWGDFQHFLGYARLDLLRRERVRRKVDTAKFLASWLDRAFLAGRPDLQKKTMIFGETIYGTSGADMAVRRYAAALHDLFTHAADVQLRDPLSVALARQAAPVGRIRFGCDCAFLLDADAMLPMAAAVAGLPADLPARYAVMAFGRSGEDERLAAFAAALARRFDVALVPIDWLKPKRHRALETIARNIALVRGAQFVVTDIYHLIVTGLREGRPVAALGWGASRGRTTLDDKKKELLLRGYFGRHLYTFIEEVIAGEKGAVDRAARALRQERRDPIVIGHCRRHREQSERRFAATLKRLVGHRRDAAP